MLAQAKRQRTHGCDTPTIDCADRLNAIVDEVLGLWIDDILRLELDPDRGETEATTMWLLLDPRPGKWNGDGHRAWRYHPAELAKLLAAKKAHSAGKRKA